MTLLLKITTVLILLTGSISQKTIPAEKEARTISTITVENLSKRWELDKYKYSIFSEAPSEKEKNDFIYFKSDMTFSSISEGESDTGKWKLNVQNKRITMSKKDEEGELVFIINHLTSKQLILIIDDPSDKDAKHLKIYFKST